MVACGAELMAPAHGLFGACTGEDVSLFAALALSIVCAAGVLATQNKRRLGLKLREVRCEESPHATRLNPVFKTLLAMYHPLFVKSSTVRIYLA